MIFLDEARSRPPPSHTSEMLLSESVARRVLLDDCALGRARLPPRVRSEVMSLEDRTAGRNVSSEVDA